MEPKVKTQKIPRASSKTQKKSTFVCTLFAELRSQGTTDSFQYPQKIPTQIKLPQKILAKFSYPKKSRNRKFQTQKNPSIIPVTWNPEYPPWGWNWCREAQNNNAPVNVKPQDRGAGHTQGDFHSVWPASVQNYWNKRMFLNKKRVQSPQDQFGTPTWPLFYCFWTPTWQTWRRVKTLYNFPRGIHWCQIPLPWGYFFEGVYERWF